MSTTYSNIYKFDPADVERFVRSGGYRAKRVGTEYSFAKCPYCHGGGSGDKDTFSISAETGQFECKRASCGAKGNMITLAQDFSGFFDLGREVKAYYNIDGHNEKFKKFRDAHRITESTSAAIEYLKSRGISEDEIRHYEITTMPEKENVLVFPFKDDTGELTTVKYRNVTHKKGDGSKEWFEKDCKPILFGMNNCVDFETLVITEGQIDSLSCSTAGIPNAVSVPGGKNSFTWKPHCWNWMLKFDEIVVFGDNEDGKITLAEEIAGFFPKRVRVVRAEDYCGYKDANEILQKCGAEAVRNCIKNAEYKLSRRIKDLASVEPVDLEALETLKTGFSILDHTIGGGFHAGEVIVLTGRCGEGKSTWASMVVANAIKQGYKTFCYSGELPDYVFKGWLDAQIVGEYPLTEKQQEQVNNWYREKVYIFDNSVIDDEADDLEKTMTEAVRNLGCKFIIIDNLMTAMEDKPAEDLYRQQSSFVGKLAKFAKSFNVIILLIAHPKKGSDESNDSISGSGDITNKADLVLRYQRDIGCESKTAGILKVTKNRTNGRLNNKIEMRYIEKSRRIIQESDREPEFLSSDFVPVEETDLDTIPF